MTESGPDPSTAGYPGERPRSRRPLHEEAADRLRDMIVEGELAPGERVREQAVCDRLGLSRTPLREAMKVLASEGLVILQPNRGATVSDPGPADIADTFKVIGALEALAGELACERVKENEIAEIRVLHWAGGSGVSALSRTGLAGAGNRPCRNTSKCWRRSRRVTESVWRTCCDYTSTIS
jgi:DNA-binding transcriptional regulator YhcF (GntR family)